MIYEGTASNTNAWTYWNDTGTSGTATQGHYDPWGNWNNTSSVVTTASSDSTTAWKIWTSANGTDDFSTNGEAWAYWNNYVTGQAPASCSPLQVGSLSQAETPKEREARVQKELQDRERWERRREEERLRRIAEEEQLAAGRIEAAALLDSILSSEQRKCLKENNWFLVVGRSGRIYRIRRGRVGNIDLVDPEGNIVGTYCIHPTERLPNQDDLVAQKLHLEHDDDFVRGMANKRATFHDDVIDLSSITPSLSLH